MVILVCGGRDFNDETLVNTVLDSYLGRVKVIVHGDCSGADKLAARWARKNNIEERAYPADWAKYGRSAGYIRNALMIQKEKPNGVIAFPGGKGTQMMCKLAKEANVRVYKPGGS